MNTKESHPGLGSGALREALVKLRDEASKNAASWHATHDSSREQRAHWMTFYEGRKAAFEQTLDMLAAPTQLTVPAQDEKPVIETANLVTPVGVGPGYCEDSPFSINRAALSLSSPIEPAPEVEAWNEGYDAGFGAATLKHTNPEEFARRAEHTKEVVTRAVAKWEGIDAKPISQASSEIREAGDTLWQRCLSLVERCREKTPDKWDFAHELAEICKEYAAPSRQGAAKRVEG